VSHVQRALVLNLICKFYDNIIIIWEIININDNSHDFIYTT
jgi:hypothetical protein